MGMRFHKTKKIGKTARANISRSGVSLTIGKPGRSINIGTHGVYLNVGIPGTGLSYHQQIIRPPAKLAEKMDGIGNGAQSCEKISKLVVAGYAIAQIAGGIAKGMATTRKMRENEETGITSSQNDDAVEIIEKVGENGECEIVKVEAIR